MSHIYIHFRIRIRISTCICIHILLPTFHHRNSLQEAGQRVCSNGPKQHLHFTTLQSTLGLTKSHSEEGTLPSSEFESRYSSSSFVSSPMLLGIFPFRRLARKLRNFNFFSCPMAGVCNILLQYNWSVPM